MAKLKIYRLQRRRIFSALLLVIFLLCACGKIPPESGNATEAYEQKTDVSNIEVELELPENAELTECVALLQDCASVIYVAINPKLALYLDEKNVVIGVECLNQDAVQVISDINLIGESMEQCMEMIIETAIEKEFLKEGKEVQIEVARVTDHVDNEEIHRQLENVITKTAAKQDMEVNVAMGDITNPEGEAVGVIYCPECHGTGECIWCGTGDDCDACDGTKESICPTCNEGKVPCHKCNGEGQAESNVTGVQTIEVEYCTQCGARRGSAGGDTVLTCEICNGTGYHSCHACRGAKGFKCWTCDGGYEICCSDPNCPRCGGAGKAICGQCDNGWRTCNECGGTGKEVCKACSGGTTSCPHPGDAVEIRTETVEEKTESSEVCDSCNGTGTERCPSCGGEYKQTCHQCHGTGKAPCGMCEETGRCMHCGGDGFVEL